MSCALAAAPDAAAPRLVPIAAPSVAAAARPKQREPTTCGEVRDYRTQFEGKTLRVLRGEFHRHTELSADGGGDGSLEDMWRYALDAAALDWLGNGDHDNGDRRVPLVADPEDHARSSARRRFTPMYTYERSWTTPTAIATWSSRSAASGPCRGWTAAWASDLDDEPRRPAPASPDTHMLYHYLHGLRRHLRLAHQRDRHGDRLARQATANVEPIVEIYQGTARTTSCPARPRLPTERTRRETPAGSIRWDSSAGLLKGISPGLRVLQRSPLHAHQLLQRVRGEARRARRSSRR